MSAIWWIIIGGLLSVVYGVVTTSSLMKADSGSARMQKSPARSLKARRPISIASTSRSRSSGVVIFVLVAWCWAWPLASAL